MKANTCTLTTFSVRTITTQTLLNATFTKTTNPTLTPNLSPQLQYPTSRALLRLSHGSYNLTTSVSLTTDYDFTTIIRTLNIRLTEHKRVTKNGDVNDHITEHHLHTNHRIDWDSAECVTYSTDCYKRLTLESWFTNLEQTPLNRCQQLPAAYKRLFNRTDKH